MPSDAVSTALTVLSGSRDAYRSAVVTATEELRALLARQDRGDDQRAGALGSSLGRFARGRIDSGALATLLAPGEVMAPEAVSVLERAAAVLSEAAEVSGAEGLHFTVAVPPGEDLRDVVRDRLAVAGRVFGAARAADLARTGRWRAREHASYFEGLPFRRWNSRERQVAPPLVVEVRGEDLRPAGLADFLDGGVKIVLVVRGEAPPAALARVVTPGVMVIQTADPAELAPLSEVHGPALAAVFEADAGAVPFVHDPRGGELSWDRIRLSEAPEAVRDRLEERRWRDRSWKEDLSHLLGLATFPAARRSDPAAGPGAPGGETTRDPVTEADRLAAWLLAETDLSEPGAGGGA